MLCVSGRIGHEIMSWVIKSHNVYFRGWKFDFEYTHHLEEAYKFSSFEEANKLKNMLANIRVMKFEDAILESVMKS